MAAKLERCNVIDYRAILDVESSSEEEELSAGPRASTKEQTPNVVDVNFVIVAAHGIPVADLLTSDPYCILKIGEVRYKTATVYSTLDPVFNEEVWLRSVEDEKLIRLEIWDKEMFRADRFLAAVEYTLSTQDVMNQPIRKSLPLEQFGKLKGDIQFQYTLKPAATPDLPLAHVGPVRYRRCVSSLAGWVSRICGDEMRGAWTSFKVHLFGTSDFFKGVKTGWNRDYAAAKLIFGNPKIMSVVRTQHKYLYSEHRSKQHRGTLRTGLDLLSTFDFGMRAGEPRYYTYVIVRDTMCFSETGAFLFTDMLSKHAMHAGCAEEIWYAGEFCVMRDDLGVPRMVIDNNSGTYSPPDHLLPAVAELLEHNFPGLQVETVSVDDPKLQEYHLKVPSRLKNQPDDQLQPHEVEEASQRHSVSLPQQLPLGSVDAAAGQQLPAQPSPQGSDTLGSAGTPRKGSTTSSASRQASRAIHDTDFVRSQTRQASRRLSGP
mmetsp:Transcript_38645/g.85971  ORF Transcript_38645/g.85971 Transcript_38645/m.85971 type:complete len:488 (-) Transcript_38645:517-1980(-)|eukprot:CAMPEP_0202907850 /NCGR_PEP_ID=MMETSP1392-20130828/44053_1 /ASSEMBLY_ACC=CAM_ASM_000868 /TAXON_ID=225041 /ORGANISM="Chlamydomonas chlamydogama, Strain SAG 11-48b" /LENGTH=487 /DNA_ID=CAMNT_0049596919 /DNA_START=258 /DNA_END=1721 /DNA_ORIENTATION=+